MHDTNEGVLAKYPSPIWCESQIPCPPCLSILTVKRALTALFRDSRVIPVKLSLILISEKRRAFTLKEHKHLGIFMNLHTHIEPDKIGLSSKNLFS